MATILKKALTLNEVAEYTGYSKSYILKLSWYGKIPCFKPNGKALFFDKDEIDVWLLRNKKTAAGAIQTDAATQVTLKQGKQNYLKKKGQGI